MLILQRFRDGDGAVVALAGGGERHELHVAELVSDAAPGFANQRALAGFAFAVFVLPAALFVIVMGNSIVRDNRRIPLLSLASPAHAKGAGCWRAGGQTYPASAQVLAVSASLTIRLSMVVALRMVCASRAAARHRVSR